MKEKKIGFSIVFKGAERFLVKFLGLVVSIVLARLLAPEKFGQVAIITVFINLCQVFVDSGLNSALVQNKKADSVDYSTVFYISLAVAAIMSAALILTAPIIGEYYENDAIVLPLRVYSLSLFVSAFSAVQNAKLQREMKFRTVLYTSLSATILSAAIGITLAALGAGIWALIVYYFAYTVFSSMAILIADRWVPTIEFSLSRAKELFSYGWKMLVSGLLCSLYADIRTLIIGKMFSEAQLGYYNRGQQLPTIISGTAETTINSVIFPAMSEKQSDSGAVKALAKQTVTIGCLLMIPLMVGLSIAAENIVSVLLTDKWLPAVPYMQIICIGSANIALVCGGLVSIKSIGRSDVYMKLELVRRIAMLAVLLVSVFAFKSVEAIAWGYAISSWIDVAIISVPVKRLIGYGLLEQLRDMWKTLAASLLMGAAVFAVGLISAPAWLLLLLQIVAGILSYIALCYVLKIDSFQQIANKALQIIKKQSKG